MTTSCTLRRNSVSDNQMDLRRFFNTSEEEPNPRDTIITGTVPEWLNGVLVRVGPGKFDLGDFTVNHFLDGFAMLYNFIIKDGKVTYRSRFLQSDAYQRALVVQRPVFTEFGTKAYTDPGKNVITRLVNKIVPTDFTDNDAINVYQLCGEVYCSTESCHIRRIDPQTIDTLEKVDMNCVTGVNIVSAHAQVAPDGVGYNVGSSFLSGVKYQILKFKPPATRSDPAQPGDPKAFQDASILCTIPSRWKTHFSYYHSFGLSENYVVLVEQPLLVNALKLATINVKGRSLRECIEWRADEKTRFIVVDRHTGKVSKVTYVSDAFFMLHHINTYEDDGHLVCDILTFRTLDVLDKWFITCLRNNDFHSNDLPKSQRFVIPLGPRADGQVGSNLNKLSYSTAVAEREPDGTVHLTCENIAEPGFELPQLNKAFSCRKYNYVFGSGAFLKGPYKSSVCKVNVNTKQVTVYNHCDHCYPGEPVFVPRPGATEEDDGVLLTVAIDIRPDEADQLIILDAKSLTEVARVMVPVKVPALIHGTFVNLSKES